MTGSANPPLRWGVVGIGSFLEGTIAPAMVTEADISLVAAVSRDLGRARDFADRFGATHAYDDYATMLANPEVDAVYIATPNDQHPRQVVAAAAAGKHVFCEKPLANTVTEAADAVTACDRAGVRLGIDFHNRYVPWVQEVAAMVADGAIGEVSLIEVDVGSGPRHYVNWRADSEIAGLGSVHNVGVHALDFLRVILGAEPVEVSAVFDQAPGSGSVEMLAMVVLRFANDALAYLNCNERLQHPTNSISVYGSGGRIRGIGLTRSRVGGDLTVITDEGETVTHHPAVEAHRRCLAAFTEAVRAGREPVPSGIDGLRSAQICHAIAVSARERRIVEVDYAT